jgi:hypothetical protein
MTWERPGNSSGRRPSCETPSSPAGTGRCCLVLPWFMLMSCTRFRGETEDLVRRTAFGSPPLLNAYSRAVESAAAQGHVMIELVGQVVVQPGHTRPAGPSPADLRGFPQMSSRVSPQPVSCTSRARSHGDSRATTGKRGQNLTDCARNTSLLTRPYGPHLCTAVLGALILPARHKQTCHQALAGQAGLGDGWYKHQTRTR